MLNPSMRANRRMHELLGDDLAACSANLSLAPFTKLADLAAQLDFSQHRGILFVGRIRPTPTDDPTGTECQMNRWHIEDLVPPSYKTPRGLAEAGIAFAMSLLGKAKASGPGTPLRAIISVQEKTDDIPYQGCTVRLHTLRPNNPWLADDLDGYRTEALLVIDT
jgi:hypothetical protein